MTTTKNTVNAEDKFCSSYVEVKKSACFECEYQSKKEPRLCLAFPKGIPLQFYTGEEKHDKPYKGDHGLQFNTKLESLGEANAG